MNKLSEDLDEIAGDYSFISGSWLKAAASEARQLENQILAMRNCSNCANYTTSSYTYYHTTHKICEPCLDSDNLDAWKLKEKK